ncbi:MAG: hypothetical protein HYR51_14015 [Candidatus Rokubacteria bacterium]|nr:hypothetical protein [Candidatus Rokubacteria bacterium]
MDQPPDVGLLVVHGIGEQRRGETTEKLLRGLHECYGDRLRVERDAAGAARGLRVGARTVRVYEVHWATILGKARVTGTFRWKLLHELAWFPWLNWKAGLLRAPEYTRLQVLAWTILLVPMTLAAFPVYWGLGLIAKLVAGVREARTEPPPSLRDVFSREKRRERSRRAAESRTVVDDVLDSYAGDVVNYMTSLCRVAFDDAHRQLDTAARDILACFYEQLAAAHRDGCREVQILAHSLGTVVTYHALTGACAELVDGDTPPHQPKLASITRVYTIGSPLEKFRFFWPATIRGRAVGVEGWRVQWDNFRHLFDPVAGRLRRFSSWGGVTNHALLRGGGVLRSHVVYERSETVLSVLTAGLFGEACAPRRPEWRRTLDLVTSTAENLATPVVLVALWLVGASFVVATPIIPGWLFSLPFRWLGWPGWVTAIQLVFLGSALITLAHFTIVDVRGSAKRWHAQWTRS